MVKKIFWLRNKKCPFFLFFLLKIFTIHSQDLEPRVYANVPKDLNVIAAGYGFIDGNVLTEPSLPIKDFKIQSHNLVGSYIRTFGMADKLARIQIVIPYAFMDGAATINDGSVLEGSRQGFADMKIRFGINLLGSPALARKDFISFEQKTILGVSLVTSIPTGKYYDDKRINIGNNRWAFKPEIGVSHRFAHFYAEMYGGIWFYTDNKNFMGKKLEQKQTYSLQMHGNYYFKNNMWFGLNTNWFFGGETITDGIADDSAIDNWRVGATFSTPIAKGQSLRFQYHIGAYTNNGLNYYALTASYQYSFF